MSDESGERRFDQGRPVVETERAELWIISFLMDSRDVGPGPFYSHCLRRLKRARLLFRFDTLFAAATLTGVTLWRLRYHGAPAWAIAPLPILFILALPAVYLWTGIRAHVGVSRLVESRILEEVASTPTRPTDLVLDSCLFHARCGLLPLATWIAASIVCLFPIGASSISHLPILACTITAVPLLLISLGKTASLCGWLALGLSPAAALSRTAPFFWRGGFVIAFLCLPLAILAIWLSGVGWFWACGPAVVFLVLFFFVLRGKGVRRFDARTEEFLDGQFNRRELAPRPSHGGKDVFI